MAKYISYLWREVSNDNYWRIQTTDPVVKRKLNRSLIWELKQYG